jgi:hypothetical protein
MRRLSRRMAERLENLDQYLGRYPQPAEGASEMAESWKERRAELGAQVAAHRVLEDAITGHHSDCYRYRALRPDDTYWEERDRVISPLLELHSQSPALHGDGTRSKTCHYGSGVHDGWQARVTWEQRNEVLPTGYERGYEAALSVARSLLERQDWRIESGIGTQDYKRALEEIIRELEAER